MRNLPTTVAMVLLCLATAPGNATEAVGRLFMTPAERADLDAVRDLGSEDTPDALRQDPPRTASPDQQVILNGVVRRSRGPAVVWVNGARATNAADQIVHLRGGPDRRNQVTLEAASGTLARLKPGQVWIPATGRVTDCFGCVPDRQPAEVITAPAAAAKTPDAPPTVQR